MKMKWNAAPIWGLVLACFATSAGAAEGVNSPVPTAVKEVPVPVKVENLDKAPIPKRLVLSNFVVEYQQRYEKKNTGFSLLGMGNAGSSKAVNDATLPDASTLQAITNYAYLSTLQMLKARGYEVVEVNKLSDKSRASYEKLSKTAPIQNGEVFSNIDGESVLYSPDGMVSSIPNAGCTHYGSEKTLANMANNSRISGTGYQTEYENQIANAEGKAPLLKVWITVGFGDATANGGNAFESAQQRDALGNTRTTVRNSANANATAGMYLKPEVTRFAIAMPTQTDYKTNHGCGMRLSKSTLLSPADGDAFIKLADRYHYDNSNVLSASSQAGSIAINDTAIGGGVGLRTVRENSDGTQAGAASNGNGVTLVNKGTQSSGRVDTTGYNTSINSVTEFATVISADLYATSALSMIYKASNAFVSALP